MSTPPALDSFDVLSFDCYGTMIDWETGIWDALQPLWAEQSGTTRLASRREALQLFAAVESEVEAAQPTLLYPDILARVHHRIAEDLGFDSSTALDADFGASVAHWPAFTDSAEALRELSSRYKLVILSNVHRDGIAASVRKLGVPFDAIYTAEEIGSYKPSARNFEYLLERLRGDLGIDRGRVLHTAQSLFHDHAPAQAIGLRRAWIDRQNLRDSGSWGATTPLESRPEVDFVFTSLGAMAAATRP